MPLGGTAEPQQNPVKPLPCIWNSESKFPVATRVGKLIGELGPSVSASEKSLRYMFSLLSKGSYKGMY